MASNKSQILMSVRQELNKEALIYDAKGRVEFIYTAPCFAETGDPCILKQFIYYPGTNIVKGRAEGYSVWNDDFVGLLDFLVDDLDNFLIDDLSNFLQASPAIVNPVLLENDLGTLLVDDLGNILKGF